MKVDREVIDGLFFKVYHLNSQETSILNLIKLDGVIRFSTKYGDEDCLDLTNQFRLGDCDDLIQNEFIRIDMNSWEHYYTLTEDGLLFANNSIAM